MSGYKYVVTLPDGTPVKEFSDLSGVRGAKAFLDREENKLPSGSCVIRTSDGKALAIKSKTYTPSTY